MREQIPTTNRVAGWLQGRFLWLLVAAYVAAAVVPGPGRWLSEARGELSVRGVELAGSAPKAMLAVLLFAAGLAVKGSQLRGLVRRPGVVGLGVAASVALPVMVLLTAAAALTLWPDPVEARDLVVGLAIVAAMPVAGSSAGWARAADGDCTVSLGLVLLSTLLSPVTTPLAFRAVGNILPGDAGHHLEALAAAGDAGVFLAAWVVAPMALGATVRWVVGGRWADAAGPRVRVITSITLLVLCYANASACLPGVLADPDWDFLVLIVIASAGLCGTAFAAGFWVARRLTADPAARASLVFGIGMANNGAGLALAAGTLAACPMALAPVICVNLVQHLAAGWANARLVASRVESQVGRASPIGL